MKFALNPAPYKLAAIDLDGTLLGPDLKISSENLRALRALQERQIEIVIASGRHYLSIRPFLEALTEVHWIVSIQGGEISDRDRQLVLGRNYMPAANIEPVLAQASPMRVTPVIYGTNGVFTDVAANENLAFYQHLSGLLPIQIPRADLLRSAVFKVILVGLPEQIAAIMAEHSENPGFTAVRTHSRIIEFMPNDINKATGLQIVGSHLGISAAETMVFGDADNDIPMFQWAGLSVAMAHGWPSAIKNATAVSSAGLPETALARAIDAILAGELCC